MFSFSLLCDCGPLRHELLPLQPLFVIGLLSLEGPVHEHQVLFLIRHGFAIAATHCIRESPGFSRMRKNNDFSPMKGRRLWGRPKRVALFVDLRQFQVAASKMNTSTLSKFLSAAHSFHRELYRGYWRMTTFPTLQTSSFGHLASRTILRQVLSVNITKTVLPSPFPLVVRRVLIGFCVGLRKKGGVT